MIHIRMEYTFKKDTYSNRIHIQKGYTLRWGVGRPSGIGWGDSVRAAVGSGPAPPTVRVFIILRIAYRDEELLLLLHTQMEYIFKRERINSILAFSV